MSEGATADAAEPHTVWDDEEQARAALVAAEGEAAPAADPRRVLTTDEVAAADLDGWRHLQRVIRVRYRTGDFATGLVLVERIGALAETADHHPDLTLTYSEVLVSLASHDVDGITSRDIDLARAISEVASELDLIADPAGLTEIDLALDTDAVEAHRAYYTALLASTLHDGELLDPSGQVPSLWWQTSDRGGTPIPAPGVTQRWHLDVWVARDEAERRLQAVLDAGGRLVSAAAAPSWWVVEDPEGNRACICTSAGR